VTAVSVPTRRIERDDCHGRLFAGVGPGPSPGVLVLHGTGGPGGYEADYARHLAHHGYTALSLTYFDAPGVPDALDQVPLETFFQGIDVLREAPETDGERVGVVGFSRGAEAALLTGVHDDRVGAAMGSVGSGYVFPAPTWMDGVDEERAAWTRDGDPVPYVPVEGSGPDDDQDFDDVATPAGGPRPFEAASEATLDAATIPVEEVDGPVLLVSGGEDAIWHTGQPATVAADRLAAADRDWPDDHRHYPDAGHAIRVPYRECDADPDEAHRLGGTHGANARAAADAFHATVDALRAGLRERERTETSGQ
jgi:dienelactone hydrolase